ncbi:MAG: DUF5050 domain-containing protein [Bacteroidota bacterium]
MKRKSYAYLLFFFTISIVLSCKDDNEKKPQASAAFTASKTTARINEEIQFTNQSQNATAFRWSFGDGTTSKDISPKKTYPTAGVYTVSLLSTGEGGSTISSQQITVEASNLYYTEINNDVIEKLTLDAAGLVSDFLDVTGKAGVGLAYDETHGKVYFSDYNVTGEGNIWQVNLDGSGLKAIVTGLYDPYQIALDVDGGKIYWAEDTDDDDNGHIGRANLDGTSKENVVTLAGGQFRAVAVDPENNALYYYEVNNEDLYKAALDGSDAAPILSGVYGYGIFVDTKNDKIYFDEQESELLLRADLDGSNVETVDDNGTRIYGIDIDYTANKLYWSGRDSGEIYMANLDGTSKVTVKSELASPRGLFLRK